MTRRLATIIAAAVAALVVLGVVDVRALASVAFLPLGSWR